MMFPKRLSASIALIRIEAGRYASMHSGDFWLLLKLIAAGIRGVATTGVDQALVGQVNRLQQLGLRIEEQRHHDLVDRPVYVLVTPLADISFLEIDLSAGLPFAIVRDDD